ncbi:ABC transporter ATP-binding protein [Alicyclobacillus fodiniaquatilis]|uniref:ABC transporter ATP-binding protein n=1 Tax=Alicyclobacillus fodiniaquatilis TaxID=1661150 RepID=A0ABW4JQX4_9BACL
MSEMVIETSNLTRRYGKKISVNNLNLHVPKGSIFGFLGPNGAGKTTTIRMLLGLIRPTSGQIRIFNQTLPKHRMQILRRTGSLVESPSYYGHLSGYENLDVIARLLKVPSKRIDEVLGIVRLTSAAKQSVKGYSLGMKQRLGIAAALLGNPDLLILDEPTNGLDPAGIHEIRALIKELPAQYGITVVVSSHLLGEIDQMATHVGIIERGHLLFQDAIEKLREQNSPKLLLQVDKPLEAKRLLQRAGLQVSMDGDILQMPNQGLAATEDVNRRLIQAGISVYRITEQSRSLEDIFLDFVDKEGSL